MPICSVRPTSWSPSASPLGSRRSTVRPRMTSPLTCPPPSRPRALTRAGSSCGASRAWSCSRGASCPAWPRASSPRGVPWRASPWIARPGRGRHVAVGRPLLPPPSDRACLVVLVRRRGRARPRRAWPWRGLTERASGAYGDPGVVETGQVGLVDFRFHGAHWGRVLALPRRQARADVGRLAGPRARTRPSSDTRSSPSVD